MALGLVPQLLNEFDGRYPGVHLQFHDVHRVAGDLGNVVYLDEYVGQFRLNLHAVAISANPGKEIAWQFKRVIRLPAKLILRLEDGRESVAISHLVEAGFGGLGRPLDPALRMWFTRESREALDAHVRAEFPRLRDLLHQRISNGSNT
jgi:hypothetical protein